MRLHLIVVVAFSVFCAGSQALSTAKDAAQTEATIVGAKKTDEVKKYLRLEDAAQGVIDTEQRRLVNIDLILKDAAVSVKKATKWKAEFKVWKFFNKKPNKLSEEWGISGLGNAMTTHKKWKKLMAYTEYYGKGPLRYP